MTVAATTDVVISVVNTNSREYLRECLASLPAACEGLTWTATVVDNASHDGSAEMVRTTFPDVTVLENTVALGFSANHNQVLKPALESDARYVLILNEDTVLDAGAICEMVSFCDSRDRVGAAGPVIVGADRQTQPSLFPFPTALTEIQATLRPGRARQESLRGGWLNGSCVLARTQALREIGLLDESFFIFFEDTDLGLRLDAAGWESAICPSAQILHHGHQVVSQPTYGDRMERQMLRSRYQYFYKHRGKHQAKVLSLVTRLALVLRASKASFLGRVRRNESETRLGALLWKLAACDPRTPLPQEELAPQDVPMRD
jgi:GT2 family glycosyltransferase